MPWEPPMDQLVTLSLRELQIVDSLVHGATAKEIARELVLSFHTVRTHIRNIYGKLDICNRVELMRWAAAHGGAGLQTAARLADTAPPSELEPGASASALRPREPAASRSAGGRRLYRRA